MLRGRTNGGGTVKLRVNDKKKIFLKKPTYAYGWWLSTCAVVVVTVDAADVKGKKRKENKTYWEVWVVNACSGGGVDAGGWWPSTHAVVVVTVDAADVKEKKRKEKRK